MAQDNQYLARLATVARRDPEARDGLTNQLRPYLELLVRRVLRRGPSSPLEHRISQVARRALGGRPTDSHCSTELVGQICRGVVARMCGDADGHWPHETEALAPHAGELATAVA